MAHVLTYISILAHREMLCSLHDRQLSCYLFYFHFHQNCANKRQNSKSSFATIYLFIIIIIFLISGHNHEIIMILFVASPCTLIKRGTN